MKIFFMRMRCSEATCCWRHSTCTCFAGNANHDFRNLCHAYRWAGFLCIWSFHSFYVSTWRQGIWPSATHGSCHGTHPVFMCHVVEKDAEPLEGVVSEGLKKLASQPPLLLFINIRSCSLGFSRYWYNSLFRWCALVASILFYSGKSGFTTISLFWRPRPKNLIKN